jgi:hypothetical protein
MKACFKCGEVKPLSDYYKHPQMGDGHLNKCKECTKRDVKDHYQMTFEERREYERNRANLPHRLDLNRRTVQRMRNEFPKKYKAHSAVSNALRKGILVRQPCERCGSLRVHGHHEDYSEPLRVMWLCPKHHKERHAELEAQGITL